MVMPMSGGLGSLVGMFSVRISVQISVPNLDRLPLEVPCPVCQLTTPITYGAVRLGDVVICRGCHANIHLKDELGSHHRWKRTFERIMKNWER